MSRSSDAYISVYIQPHTWSIAARPLAPYGGISDCFLSCADNAYPVWNNEYPFLYPVFKAIVDLDIFSYTHTYYLAVICNTAACSINLNILDNQPINDNAQQATACFADTLGQQTLCMYHTLLIQLMCLARHYNMFLILVCDALQIQDLRTQSNKKLFTRIADEHTALIHTNTHVLMENIVWK